MEYAGEEFAQVNFYGGSFLSWEYHSNFSPKNKVKFYCISNNILTLLKLSIAEAKKPYTSRVFSIFVVMFEGIIESRADL